MERFIRDLLKFTRFDFRPIRRLPASGQRTSYVGEHAGSTVVLKITPSHETAVARIQREYSVLSTMDSPFFPRIYRATFITRENLEDYYDFLVGSSQEKAAEFKTLNLKPSLYTVEEYIENISWDEALPRLREETAFSEFFTKIVCGVSLLWEKKIVHRDLKPENILIREDLSPVIIDLGIAKSFNPGTRDLTAAFFHTPCTPRFAAPEQLLNKKNEISYKADQFSIGVMAYLVLTDRFPYGDVETDGLDYVLRAMHSSGALSFEGSHVISDDIFLLTSKLLEVQPYKRFRRVDEILDALEGNRRVL